MGNNMEQDERWRELHQLRARVRVLEAELDQAGAEQNWPPRSFYTAYAVLAGFVLGAGGAMTSLLFNIVGSLLVHQHPLRLIQVYLTFPLGESALHIDSGLALAVGCCLYLLTGMVLGIPFQLVLGRYFPTASTPFRFIVVSVLALGLWLFNFYCLLAWLQPLLIGGNWIVEQIPWWVAALTHLVFGWTMLAVQPIGRFVVTSPLVAETQ
jgi:hypothetical protein